MLPIKYILCVTLDPFEIKHDPKAKSTQSYTNGLEWAPLLSMYVKEGAYGAKKLTLTKQLNYSMHVDYHITD